MQHAGVSALVSKRASQMMGVVAGMVSKGHDIASATRDVVGEARARGASVSAASRAIGKAAFGLFRSSSTDR